MSVKNDSLSITGAFVVLGPGGGGARDAQKGGLEKRTFSAHRIITPPPTSSFLQKITVRTD